MRFATLRAKPGDAEPSLREEDAETSGGWLKICMHSIRKFWLFLSVKSWLFKMGEPHHITDCEINLVRSNTSPTLPLDFFCNSEHRTPAYVGTFAGAAQRQPKYGYTLDPVSAPEKGREAQNVNHAYCCEFI